MPAKIVELTVELLVQAVSCPGVWLCPGGEVSLAVFALGCSHRTALLPPVFPLLYQDAFYFRQTFRNACSINALQCALKDETIYCELVQWTCAKEGVVLAQYLGSLSDLLFPPDTCSTDGVDLLMKTTASFPGILAPKIEISTKVRVDEVWEGGGAAPVTANGAAAKLCARNPSAERVGRDARRHKPACHSKLYHNARNRLRDKESRSSRHDETTCSCSAEFTFDSVVLPVTRSASPAVRRVSHSPSLSQEQHIGTEAKLSSSEGCAGGYKTDAGSMQRWRNADATVLRVGRERVAHVLESESGSRRGRVRSGDGERPARCGVGTAPAAACVCDICRRYHELFHAR